MTNFLPKFVHMLLYIFYTKKTEFPLFEFPYFRVLPNSPPISGHFCLKICIGVRGPWSAYESLQDKEIRSKSIYKSFAIGDEDVFWFQVADNMSTEDKIDKMYMYLEVPLTKDGIRFAIIPL